MRAIGMSSRSIACAPMTRRSLLLACLASSLGSPWANAWANDTADARAWAALRADAAIVLVRHANAPGVGDPPGMKLGDCATQRLLDESGRAQSKRLGETFAARGVKVTRVVASQWCRTMQTAQLAFPLMRVEGLEAFNSFFQSREQADARTRAAREWLQGWRGPGVLVVVTHQVNITALTGLPASVGEGVVLEPLLGRTAQDKLVVAGTFRVE
jgi:phosphohistidine phosphatase SixA